MRILITGITGTLGRAFTSLLQGKNTLIGIDRNETSVSEFKRLFPHVQVSLGDFGDVDFSQNHVDLLIHLAAMKHVDLCEENAVECVYNNVVKTRRLFQRAHKNGVRILFMSTDKAVEPTSVYGYSKALGEAMALELGGAFARSGNVVESTGSVLGVWDEAIKAKQPVKVTHPDMRRYFISPDNLVKQIWNQWQSGKKVIIPEMDREIEIMELLREKLAKHGYTEDNYPGGIEVVGLRKGEKLSERLDW